VAARARRRWPGHGVLLPWVELQGIYGVALAAPLLDAFRRSPETLTSVEAGALEVVVLALVIVIGPPLLVLVLELIVGRFHLRAQFLVHLAAIAVCGGAIALRIGREFTGGHQRLLATGLLGVDLAGRGFSGWGPLRVCARRSGEE
jgi:hypothetical protein